MNIIPWITGGIGTVAVLRSLLGNSTYSDYDLYYDKPGTDFTIGVILLVVTVIILFT